MNSIISEQLGAQNASGFLYQGEGIRAGVIVAESNTYINGTLSLEGADITALPSLLPPSEDTHPTAVLSEIVGQEVTAEGITFRGIAPRAAAYIAPIRAELGLLNAIEKMAELGIKVINFSAGVQKGGYSELDAEVDRLIEQYDILFVTVSGNERDMRSPGRAHNAVTVGNLATKDYPNIPLPEPWEVWCRAEDSCSGFSVSGVHKPDTVAPGAWIGYAVSENEINYNNFGTSFASPWAAGTAVLVYEILGTSVSYLTVKAVLLAASDNERVSAEGNPLIGEHLRLRSGYGLVNVSRAIEIAESAIIYEGRLGGDISYDIPEGERSIMLVFEKRERPIRLTLGSESFSTMEQNTLRIKKRSKEITPLSVTGEGGRFSIVISQ